MFFICEIFVWILFTYCNSKFSVSCNFIVISACSYLTTSFRYSISSSRIEDGCEALFFIASFRSCDVEVIIKISVIFVFL